MALPPEARKSRTVKKKRAPRPKPAPAPNFPKAVPKKPGAITPRRKPTAKQVRVARAQEKTYKRQGGAVRRAAKVQETLGPGIAVPHKKVLRDKTIKKVQKRKTTQAQLQERKYVSQGQAVKRAAEKPTKKKLTAKGPKLLAPTRAAITPSLAKVLSDKDVKTGADIIENAAREAVDIPANIIPTASYLTEPVIKKPLKPKSYLEAGKRTGEAVVSLPKELIKDPVKTITEKPLSTALLVAPVPKVPIRTVRAVQRRPIQVRGKTYHPIGKPKEAEVVNLPGTRMKEVRQTTTGYSRNIKKRLQKPSPTVKAKEVETRIDEAVSAMEAELRRQSAKTAKKVYRADKKLRLKEGYTKKEAKRLAGAEAARQAQLVEKKIRSERTHAMEDVMGLTERPKWRVGPGGTRLIKQGGDKAKIYKTWAIANYFAEKAKVGDVEFEPRPTRGGFAVVPKVANERWKQHTDPKEFSPVEAVSRMYSTGWRRNVLALHPTWYTGNILEAALRTAIAGAGPMSFYRGYKVPQELKNIDPEAARELGHNVYRGGHLAMQANLPREYGLNVSGSGSFAKGIRAMQAARKEKPTLKNVIDAYEGFSDFTMGTLSGGIEGFFQRGMLGKALSKDPLMNKHMVKVSKAAIEDAAKGLRATENQVKMGRIVDEMYGRYGKWSPGMRRAIANYTPFISWTMNALNFLYRTLPRDHPVLVAAAASVQPYTDEWRKDKGLNKFVRGAVPGFLQGAVPTPEGFARYPTRYTPFAAAAQFPEGIGDLFLPQYGSAIKLLQDGINWKGQKVKNPDGTPLDPIQLILAATLTLYEGAIPASQQISGPSEKYEKGERNLGKLLKPRPLKEIPPKFDPFRKVPPPKAKKKKSLFDVSSGEAKSLFDVPEERKSLFGP